MMNKDNREQIRDVRHRINRRRFLEIAGTGVTLSACSMDITSAHSAIDAENDGQDSTEKRVSELIKEMTLKEKVNRVHSHFGPLPEFATGYMTPLDRLGIPGLEMTDGPVGVRHPFLVDLPDFRDLATNSDIMSHIVNSLSGGPSTAFPASISQAATWDEDRLREFGEALGSEAKAKELDVLYAPAFNIVRVPVCGRNFEYFGEDPHLTSRAAVNIINGIQSTGVIATAKHFVANNQEQDRMSVSADIDRRTLREIYLPAFKAAVTEANVGSVMAAYNRVNGTYCTEHTDLLSSVLKEEWGFEGYVVSDSGAVNSTVAAATAGTDFELYVNYAQNGHFGPELQRAVKRGDVNEIRLDDMVSRILGQSKRFGILDGEQIGSLGEANTPAHQRLAREIAAEGGALLKNEEPGLPLVLQEIDSIAVIGPEANEAKIGGGGSSNVTPPTGSAVSPLEGIDERVGSAAEVKFDTGEIHDVTTLAADSDVAIVVATGDSTEQQDRDDLTLTRDQNDLIAEVAAANEHTVVVLRTGGPVEMPWIDAVPAVLEMWYPGMEDGNATADLLFGDVNPSGKLPITFGQAREDYPTTTEKRYPGVDRGDGFPVAEYSEGVFVGYRHFDEQDIEPLFAFGHGLSYTSFAYHNLKVTVDDRSVDKVKATVELSVENVGKRTGAEIIQLYVADEHTTIPRPPQELKAFTKVTVEPGERTTVEFELGEDAFSFYDTDAGEWVVDPGWFDILIGRSSRDIRSTERILIRESES